jgi:hypothetical protein
LRRAGAPGYTVTMSLPVTSVKDDPVVELLLTGRADTADQAERLYLEEHLDEVTSLVNSPLTDEEFRRHPLIAILLGRGSRGWEDSIL